MRISDWSSDVCSSDLLGVDLEASRWLTLRHGSDISAIAALIAAHPSLARRVHADAPFVHAEAVHAVRAEMALSVDDLARRRMPLQLLVRDDSWRAPQIGRAHV